MSRYDFPLAWLALTLSIAFPASRSMACACCADPWTQDRGPHELGEFELGELAKTGLAGALGFPWDEKGDAPPFEFESREVEGRFTGHVLRMTLSSGGKAVGSFAVDFDPMTEQERIDLRFILSAEDYKRLYGDAPPPGDARLYKKYRLKGKISPDGSLFADLGVEFGPEATLTLHAQGNVCWSDPLRWDLQFKMKKNGAVAPGFAQGTCSPLPSDVRARLDDESGQRAMERRDFSAAESAFSRAVAEEPAYFPAQIHDARALALLNQIRPALRRLAFAFKLDPAATRKAMTDEKDFDGLRSQAEFQKMLESGKAANIKD